VAHGSAGAELDLAQGQCERHGRERDQHRIKRAWGLSLIVANVVIHVFGLGMINERFVEVVGLMAARWQRRAG